jgi:tetratricopeptide (TPR) repeat protein
MLNIDIEDDLTKNQDSYDGLISTIEIGQGMLVLIIASCTARTFQSELIDRYEAELAPSIPSYRIQLDRSEPSLRQTLENLVDRHPELQVPKANAVITATGAADLLAFKLGESEENSALDRFFGYLQWTREGLREFPFPIVLWVTPQILTQLSSKAPDFWSWRGGVFRFTAPAFVSDRTTFTPTIDSSFKPESASDLPIDELLEQVSQISAKNPNSATLSTLFDRLGQAYTDRIGGNGAENRSIAIEYFQRALAIQGKLNLNRLNTLIRLANLYRRLSNWNEAEVLYLECLKIETELGDRAGMASSWGVLGSIASNRGDYDKAEAFYNQSLAVHTELGDRAGIANAWSVLGGIASNRGDYDKAEAFYNQSLAVHTELGDRAGIANAWSVLGGIASNRGDYDKAEALFNQSLAVRTEIGDHAGIAASWGVLGDIARNWGDYDKAESLYNQSLAVHTELDNRVGIAAIWCVLGDIARNRGKYDEAEALYNQCLKLYTELGDRTGMATAWGCLGENELGRGNLDAAETWLKKALTAMEDLQMTSYVAEVNWCLAQIYRAKSDEPQAEQYYSIAHELFIKLGAKGDLARIEKEWL